jgi:hypothetical protein
VSGYVNKLYSPAELVAAQKALLEADGACVVTPHIANRIIIELHKRGFRIVYVGKVGDK